MKEDNKEKLIEEMCNEICAAWFCTDYIQIVGQLMANGTL